uniref:Aa_trans domain-containing protein n=1 Tax=Parastrongyloides trichosuri TaxID=131310 RepID=A0A0N4ZIT5_PARTI
MTKKGLDSSFQDGYSLVSSTSVDIKEESQKKHRNLKGMGWIVTCLFIVGETAGGGLIAMPTAMVAAGFFGGTFMIFIGALVCSYSGIQLSENWTILQERWPEYREHCRKPYPSMGLKAIGRKFQSVVSLCLNFTQFGTAVVFLLLAAKNIENFLAAYGNIHVNFCWLVIFVALFMLPFTLLKSPKDFWWAVIGAMITTTIAVILIITGSIQDYHTCHKFNNYPPVSYSKFFMTFGTVMFAYGGHGAFPTIQHDMKKPYHFTRSVLLAFLIIASMYFPVSIMGYMSYGDSLRESVIPSLQNFVIQQAVNMLITLHVILALTIVFNPLNQEFEDLLSIPHEMGYKRVVARTVMMIAVVFVAETVPNFGVLLDLVGGSTITLMALIFPLIFNLFLSAANKKYGGKMASTEEKPLTIKEMINYTSRAKLGINLTLITIAIVGGLAATISAFRIMISSEFSPPCYSGIFSSPAENEAISESFTVHGMVNCCGVFKNITKLNDLSICRDPFAVTTGGSHG